MSLFYGDKSASLQNRRDFLAGLGIDSRDLVCASQVHGNSVHIALEQDRGRGALDYQDSLPATDALLTAVCRLPLAVFTADCLPLFLYDQKNRAIGLVHAGWKGALQGIVAKSVQAMQCEFGTRPQDLLAGFGPAIRACCYEVRQDCADFFPGFVGRRSDRLYLDLAGACLRQLLDAGLDAGRIADPGICTSCRKTEYFSYRKEGPACGRMLSVMMLK